MRVKASDLGSNWQMTRNLNFSSDYLTAIQKVTVKDLNDVLEEFFQDKNLSKHRKCRAFCSRRAKANAELSEIRDHLRKQSFAWYLPISAQPKRIA